MQPFNIYNDSQITTIGNRGFDISTQRADDLDHRAIKHIQSLSLPIYAADVGSAGGGQALRMAEAGAWVLALDLDDYSSQFLAAAETMGIRDLCYFAKADAVNFDLSKFATFDVVLSQRMLHYNRFSDGQRMLRNFRAAMRDGGRLYLSASGIHSELGNNYAGHGVPLADRYCELSQAMADKHDIRGNVCLYSEDDMRELLVSCGFKPVSIYSSEFGNVKSESVVATGR